MRAVLAVVIAMASAVLGGIVTGARSSRTRWPLLLVGVALGGLVAEGLSVLWMGAPDSPLLPGVDGLALGLLVGWLQGRPPRRPRGGRGAGGPPT
jgi:CHASE2 domain-containing sensor protein